jgi:hypothetical protein
VSLVRAGWLLEAGLHEFAEMINAFLSRSILRSRHHTIDT